MSNVDSKTKAYFDRLLRLENEKRDLAETAKDLTKEMKGCGLSKEEISGIKLAVKREFETADKKASREEAEEIADALGGFADSPLGAAAVKAARPHIKLEPAPVDDDEGFDPGPGLPFVVGERRVA